MPIPGTDVPAWWLRNRFLAALAARASSTTHVVALPACAACSGSAALGRFVARQNLFTIF
ncbi:hypothetical protein [Xanthomonas hortorum]|uniref:hypothetical protein n=1 Tax=Xanthomonas hortorum TaxID=56454 RepID=UPI0011B0A493|nr:hypothetical protein [Xanthomonas hortorum]